MCGIVGYIGNKAAQPILLQSLKRLEYRGYDSCGIALAGSCLEIYKDIGRIEKLAESLKPNSRSMGIGHTRWATHGKPSQINAHPHIDCTGQIAVVHNGVIDNYLELQAQLIYEGHKFCSETDSEVISHLIEKYHKGDLEAAVIKALAQIKGSYAIIVLNEDCPYMVIARHENPVIIGVGYHENIIASDVPAVLDYTNKVIYLEDGDVATVSRETIKIVNNGQEQKRNSEIIPWDTSDAERGGYEHFMLKEIHEQPRAITETLRGYLNQIEPKVKLEINIPDDIEDVLLLGCGSSFHATLIGKYVLETIVGIRAKVELASEFNENSPVSKKTWAIAVTQSGETADTLSALKKAKQSGAHTLAITNVIGSSATRIADQCFFTRAGPEIGVAATKTFITQLISFYLLALAWPSLDGKHNLIPELGRLPGKVQRLLNQQAEIARHTEGLSCFDDALFVGRGINYPVALEGALKLKEISYIHAEGYSAGELKHGPFALLSPKTPVVVIVGMDITREMLLANIREIKARESPLLAIADEKDTEIDKYVDWVIKVPNTEPLLSPVINSVALQLLAYFAAARRHCPIDLPRNLAKSVTVP
ncbi:MAG: glutamine--fructose-6-phosphate transaminase (isomerizing) [Candidatus Tectomicrobia bacterium]|uniref:Glutamine--fructose-6-phosphate aminotransferase [isomerizing] n=1 Tax=Tectimicrobiota bacterium TaxID=2528274 RepID=A0A933GJC5_UNCTE|nr:glutamine--fructose-6-phosphate transaminase (isomerizing) [Candidatus Tectomicrobia bacterium]